jgi:hypothetical protein
MAGFFKSFYKKHQNLILWSFCIVTAVIMVLFIKCIFLLAINYQNKKPKGFDGILVIYDSLLGYKPKPDCIHRSIKKSNDGTLIYDVQNSIDGNSHRITPVQDGSDRKCFILFFGCSFTYGEGLEDNQTLPFYVAQFCPEYMPYNFAFRGYGPQNMTAQLSSPTLQQQIKEKQGLGIYVYNAWHIARTNGFMSVYNWWGRTLPNYFITKDGSVKRDGDFTTGRPWRSLLFQLLHKTRIAALFKMEIPPSINDKHIDLVCALIKESQTRFLKKFPGGRFYVLFHPYCTGNTTRITHYLQDNGIGFFAYPGLYDEDMATDWKHIITGDGHPSAYANKKLAEKLSADINDLNLAGH